MMMVLIHCSSYPMGGMKFSMFENLHICEKENASNESFMGMVKFINV
jgi:hypothetical protein